MVRAALARNFSHAPFTAPATRRVAPSSQSTAAPFRATSIGTELFGYADGAFTGARAKGHTGKIVAAHEGTLCLDEIGEMPMELQQYLLRVVEDGIVYPLASNEGRLVKIRVRNIP